MLPAAVVPVLLIVHGTAEAGSASSTMAVTVEVLPNCSLSASPLVLQGQGSDTAGGEATIAVTCAPDQPFALALDHGQHAVGLARHAVDPATLRRLGYEIFSDPARSRRWADRSGETVDGVTNGAGRATVTAYASLSETPPFASGRYADQITVTLNF
ncbi:spore coat protein U-like protein [Novosphingobium kunmingense]|uniref:Spore coat protein U-like protein n=1 Tax=Novosphingobium kunmingense TaxID=1211806 RepID=A0A2N0H523_9SPHN|nr:spore coat U domain-containing protein [Novosphingobium kunmingense]PKB14024.1 spore coat protein U-like protein [Novosphingobium kunmingense]